MKIIPFSVPKTGHEAFRLQIDRQSHFYDTLHQHSETQIMWIMKSEGTLIAGDYVGRFKEGDLFLIGSQQPHVFRNDDKYLHTKSKHAAQAISIYFDEGYAGSSFWQLNELKRVRLFLEKSKQGLRIEGKTRTDLISLINLLTVQKGIEKLIGFFRILMLLSSSKELRFLSVTALTPGYTSREEKRMNDIVQFMFQESHRSIYLDEAAAVANLSVEAFCRYFKLRTQKTFTNFLNEVRISKACQQLIHSDKSVQEIGYEVGFNNLSQFNRVFKRITGKTPRHYIS